MNNSRAFRGYDAWKTAAPEDGRDPTPLEDAILTLLEDAEIPTEYNDRMMAVLNEWYCEQARIEDEAENEAEQRERAAGRCDCGKDAYVGWEGPHTTWCPAALKAI
jgi:hypothetical protein